MNDFAKQLRKRSTDAELKLWHYLRNRQMQGHKFRRQHPIPPYVVDFVCLEQGLIIELDGSQHIELADKDAKRTQALAVKGFRLIRFWDNDVLLRTGSVLEEIHRNLAAPPLQGAQPAASDCRSPGESHAIRNTGLTPNLSS